MQNFINFLFENTDHDENKIYVPKILYHATYQPYLKSILKHGLGGKPMNKNYSDSQPGLVYLATDPHVAESYAETSDLVDEELLDDIVVLKVETRGLDLSKFKIDPNNQTGDTLCYTGVIPSSHIEASRG